MINSYKTDRWNMYLFMVVVVSSLALAAPPSLDNHQFYGVVQWDEFDIAPTSVVAQTSQGEFVSAIADVLCDGDVCVGTYGKHADDLLYVQGEEDGLVTFYLNGIEVTSVVYQDGKASELDLNIASVPLIEIDEDELVLEDEPIDSSALENEGDSSLADPSTVCSYEWECGEWSDCSVAGTQTRECSRKDECDVKFALGEVTSINKVAKPKESNLCSPGPAGSASSFDANFAESLGSEPSCFDGVQNQGEEGVDCGGPCSSCVKDGALAKEEVGSEVPLWVYVVGVILVLGAIIAAVIVYLRSRHGNGDAAMMGQLRGVYEQGMQKGLSKRQVTQKLQEKGWDSRVLEKFLKK